MRHCHTVDQKPLTDLLQTSYKLVPDRSRNPALRYRQITAWNMGRP